METGEGPFDTSRLPEWLRDEVEHMDRRIDKCNPYPFQHPEDLSGYVCLHQNDYLRLSCRPEVIAEKEEVMRRFGNSFLAATIFNGGEGADEHDRFRSLVARTMGCEDVILTTSGWTANVGLIEAIALRGAPVYIDRKAHASIWDGARMSAGRTIMVGHNDPVSLERRIRREGAGVICIDSVYSTTGAIAHLPSYVDIAERTGSILVVDEAHGFGLFGENGGGLAEQQGVADRIHFRTVSFSKALGGHGGCVATTKHLAWYLTHRARPLVFSSAVLPCDSAAHRKALEILRAEPQLAHRAREMADVLRQEMEIRGIPTSGSASQIVSYVAHSDEHSCAIYGELRKRGVLGAVFLEPAVAVGAGLVRFSVHAECTRDEMIHVAAALRESLDAIDQRNGTRFGEQRHAA